MENPQYTKINELAQAADELFYMVKNMPYGEIISEHNNNDIEHIERAAKTLTEFIKFLRRQSRQVKK